MMFERMRNQPEKNGELDIWVTAMVIPYNPMYLYLKCLTAQEIFPPIYEKNC